MGATENDSHWPEISVQARVEPASLDAAVNATLHSANQVIKKKLSKNIRNAAKIIVKSIKVAQQAGRGEINKPTSEDQSAYQAFASPSLAPMKPCEVKVKKLPPVTLGDSGTEKVRVVASLEDFIGSDDAFAASNEEDISSGGYESKRLSPANKSDASDEELYLAIQRAREAAEKKSKEKKPRKKKKKYDKSNKENQAQGKAYQSKISGSKPKSSSSWWSRFRERRAKSKGLSPAHCKSLSNASQQSAVAGHRSIEVLNRQRSRSRADLVPPPHL